MSNTNYCEINQNFTQKKGEKEEGGITGIIDVNMVIFLELKQD
jgi:hypothetical protein